MSFSINIPPGTSRNLQFASAVGEDVVLLEVDDSLLNFILEGGVSIKGGPDDEAVLVTQDSTYALKYVETTNMQLLLAPSAQVGSEDVEPNGGDENVDCNLPKFPGLMTQMAKSARASESAPVVVSAVSRGHIEVVPVAPRTGLLCEMLAGSRYGMEDEEQGEPGPRLYSLEELLDVCQASRAEVLAALYAMNALEIGGHWRLVDPHYLGQLLELIILSAQEVGAGLDAVPQAQVLSALKPEGYPEELVLHCLRVYGGPTPTQASGAEGLQREGAQGMDVDDPGTSACTWSLDEQKICLHFAVKLLSQRAWTYREFMASWEAAVPAGMRPSAEMLKGEVLMEGNGSDRRLRYFPASALPLEPAQRFAALFKERPRWEKSELEPYLSGIKVPGLSLEAALLKYARASQTHPQDPVVYSAR